jgi:hypothetical protein
MTINCAIKIVWGIKNINHYGFGTDNCLYNLKTGRKIKQCYNCRCVGYWIDRKFYSLKKLRPLLIRPEKEYCPF